MANIKLPPIDVIDNSSTNIMNNLVSSKNINDMVSDESFHPNYDLRLLNPYPEHKFRLWEGERFASMVESIIERGILHPIIAWDCGGQSGKVIILSGHNRQLASIEAEKYFGPVIIKKNLTNEEADLIVTETNLLQRSFADLRHSERAYCLKQHYNAMKKQGKRTDLLSEINSLITGVNPHEISDISTSDRIGQKLENRDKLAEEFGLSKTNIAMYIRIAELNKYLMKVLDDGTLPFTSAYNLAFIGRDKQNEIAGILENNQEYKVDIKKATALRSDYDDGKLTSSRISDILSGSKSPKKIKRFGVQIKSSIITKYFTKGENKKEISDIIEKALEKYFS